MSRVIAIRQGQPRAVIMAGLRGAPGIGSAGVTSFNTRTGTVTLTGADVTDALAYTPADSSSLAAVAFSGNYSDLIGTPFIPAAPGDIGAATAAQGALADTAVQPAALAVQLDLKVDKLTGYGLSQENFTAAEKSKLAGLEGSHYRGTFVNLAALQAAIPAAQEGDYADVDAGASAPVQRYIWDESDGEWVAQAGSADPITAAQVKTLYESNPDTNAYTDAEKTKVAGIAAGATANATDAQLRDRTTHTGTQAASTISDFTSAVRAQIEAMLGEGSNVTFNLTGTGDTRQLTISAAGGGGGVSLPVVQQLASTRDLGLADINAFNVNSTANNYTVTIPLQAAVAWTADAEIHFLKANTGNIVIQAPAGVTLNGVDGGSATMQIQNGAASIKRLAENSWWVGGLLESLPSVFTAEYASPEQVITSGGLLTLTHGLGAAPRLVMYEAVCKVAENGYSVGDVIQVYLNNSTSTVNRTSSCFADATNISFRYSSDSIVFICSIKNTGVIGALTNANWRLIVRAWA